MNPKKTSNTIKVEKMIKHLLKKDQLFLIFSVNWQNLGLVKILSLSDN